MVTSDLLALYLMIWQLLSAMYGETVRGGGDVGRGCVGSVGGSITLWSKEVHV